MDITLIHSKSGKSWEIDGQRVDSYELYAVYGRLIGKSPKQITVSDVRNFAEWRKNPNRIRDSFTTTGEPTK